MKGVNCPQCGVKDVQAGATYCSKLCRDGAYRARLRSTVPRPQGYHISFIVNDTQFPYHDKYLFEVVCQVAQDVQPDTLIFNGDMFDFDMLSRFPDVPQKQDTLGWAVTKGHNAVTKPLLKVAKPDQVVWLDGNHEERIERYIVEKCPELSDMLDPPKMMQVDQWTYYPYVKGVGHMLAPDLMVTHGWSVSKHSGYSAKVHVDDTGLSVLIGHTHRRSHYAKTTPERAVRAYEMGHMADADVLPGFAQGGVPNWQQTAGTIVRVDKENPYSWTVEQTEVFGKVGDRRVFANGREYRFK